MDSMETLPSLFVELYELERLGGYRRPICEADRLGDITPTLALRAVAAHANEALDEMPKLARARGIALATLASFLNDATAYLFRAVMSRFADVEQSYRGTLLELYRGISVARRVRALAFAGGDSELAAWCDGWIDCRSRLLRAAVTELDWFGRQRLPGGDVVRALHPRPA